MKIEPKPRKNSDRRSGNRRQEDIPVKLDRREKEDRRTGMDRRFKRA